MSSQNDDNSCDGNSFFMPAEWEPHAACIVLYPHQIETYPQLQEAQDQIMHLCHVIATVGQETVWLLCPDDETARHVQTKIGNRARTADKDTDIVVSMVPSDDTWARDTAPTFLVSRKKGVAGLKAMDWEFNAYGGPKEGCYWPCELDRQIPLRICELLQQQQLQSRILKRPDTKEPTSSSAVVQREKVPLVLEGGSIHTDGRGTLLTTQECLLHPNRNPDLNQTQIQDLVCRATGCNTQSSIWLPTGLAYDEDTNGHVDNFACFVRPGHVVLAWTDDDVNDPENYQRCRDARRVLEQEHSLVVSELYLPSPPLVYTEADLSSSLSAQEQQPKNAGATGVDDDDAKAVERRVGQRLAASYVNFYIANSAVLVPQFGVEEYDRRALETLQPLFPGRTVVGVPSRAILLGGGNIHCMTQQIPAVKF